MTRLLRLARLEGVPRRVLVLTTWASVLAVLVALYQSWAVWAIVSAAVLPWFLPLAIQTTWLSRHYGWFALFFLLVVTQGGHYIEHVIQMIQKHPLGQGLAASGVIGVLDIELVHFGWNTFVFLASVALVIRFRRNPWLWMLLIAAIWHQIEHTYVTYHYVTSGVAPAGFLPRAGLVNGGKGLPIDGPDLHFIYNTIETFPLFAGFIYQLRRTHDNWIERAFPVLSGEALGRATRDSRVRRFQPEEVIVEQGATADACFVVVRGELEVSRSDGAPTIIGPGQYFGETVLLSAAVRTATVRARTAGELVEVDADTFRDILEGSPQAAEDLRQLAMHRSTGT